jgi:hypothetical protein
MADGKCDHSACMEWTCKEWCQCYQLGDVANGLMMSRFSFSTVIGFYQKKFPGTIATRYLETMGEKMPFPADVPTLAGLAAPQLSGTKRRAYAVLVEMLHALGWETLLELRAEVFLVDGADSTESDSGSQSESESELEPELDPASAGQEQEQRRGGGGGTRVEFSK